MKRAITIASAILALTTLPFSTVSAQKNRKPAKNVKVVVAEPTEEEMNFENLLPSTAKVMFIDSVVIDKADMAKYMPLSRSCGSIEVTQKDSTLNYTFTNEFGNRRYLSIADANGSHKLYVQDKLGRNWSEPERVELEGDFKDIICPYVMPDGVTLSFAALNGEDNLGKHDIFYTVYDSDNGSFYRPQSLGLPFNSSSDDFFYVIDDFSNLGYLATSRRQKSGKVCIYTFVPTESRETYDTEKVSETQLKRIAQLHSIADTQSDLHALSDARKRFDDLRASVSGDNSADQRILFVINGSTTYTRLSQFKSATNREKYLSYSKRKNALRQQELSLADMRVRYHSGEKALAGQIISLEEQLQTERLDLSKQEKQIRNAELINR